MRNIPSIWNRPFFTFPLVITKDPSRNRQNMGIYRMQVFDGKTTGMHWQVEKGGRFHSIASKSTGSPMPVAVVVGADPALLLSAVLPLPEGIDEMAFAGFLRGSPTDVMKCRTIPILVPSNAEFILEGTVDLKNSREEGPFGDHYGHYSMPAPFPVFDIKYLRQRKNAIFQATVVGKPPMEDWHLGVMTMQLLKPLIRIMHPEIKDLWAYPEAGFHNLLVISVNERYGREALKSAFFLLGTGQTSLARFVIIVGENVNVRNFDEVMMSLGDSFDPSEDLCLIAPTSTDTLDFSGEKFEFGSKLILTGTKTRNTIQETPSTEKIRSEFPDITKCRLVGKTLLAIQSEAVNTQDLLTGILSSPSLGSIKFVAAVSGDIDLADTSSLIWGIFTRFNPASDMIPETVAIEGVRAVIRGRIGIDATLKNVYPIALEMDENIKKMVDSRWKEYFS